MADKDLEWTELNRKEILKTRVFTVTERESASPAGARGVYVVNEAPDWVIVIPVVGDSFLMVRQWRHGEKALSMEFPGGVIDKGEDPAVAAARELMEETSARAGRLTKLGMMNPNPALFANHVHVFLAEDLEFTGKQHLDSDEYVKYKTIDQREVLKNMGHGEYCHALMAAAAALFMSHSL